MALKVNRIASGYLAETRITKFVGEDAIANKFLPIYEALYQNLHMPDDLSWRPIEPQSCAWDAQRELWLITAHRNNGEDLSSAIGALVLGRYCAPRSTHEEIGIHVAKQVDADLRFFGPSLLAEVTAQDLEILTQRGSLPDDDPEHDRHRRIEILKAQALQEYLDGWAQTIALYVRPEHRHKRVASHLLCIAKRTLVEQATPSLGLIGKTIPSEHPSQVKEWSSVSRANEAQLGV